MTIDIDQYLPADIHTKVDRATMAASLEARVPLLGGPVARLAAAMPTDVKIRGGVGKWPLKELLRRRGFSEEFVHRRKAGFSFPMSDWLRRAIDRRPEYEDLLRNPPAPLDRQATGAELDRLVGGADSGHSLWSLLVLSAWLTRNTT
jgi:asparagine synthase (glutamine-hydrolysing)